jgi:MYXO-CTERM domain-containing protein
VSRSTHRVLGAVLTTVCALACVERAQAYSERDKYERTVGLGGGGGRYFTGSPVDGYACSVCHQGAPEPKVSVIGLPEDGYEPGRLYEIEIAWDNSNPMFRQALHLEFVGRDGKAAGQLVRIDPDVRQVCSGMENRTADYQLEPSGRKILGVAPCGSGHVRFRFSPPETDDVAFAMSLVVSDRGGSAEGDGVYNHQQVLRRIGVKGPEQGCAVHTPGATASSVFAALLSALGLILHRRRRR